VLDFEYSLFIGRQSEGDQYMSLRLNSKQICSIKYYHESNTFVGKCILPDDTFETTEVSEEWVKENFPPRFIEEVKKFGNLRKHFINVPPGKRSKRPKRRSHVDNSTPRCLFKQESESTCATSSMACAMAFLGYQDEAAAVFQFGEKDANNETSTESSSRILERMIQFIQRNLKSFNRALGHKKLPRDHDILIPGEKNNLCIVVLRSADGATNHAVATVNEWIFDANEDYAMPLSQDSLNECCCSRFISIAYGYNFAPYRRREFKHGSSPEQYFGSQETCA
jgi:hypothetical protein